MIRRIAIAAVIAAATTATPVFAAQQTFAAHMLGAAEAPPNASPGFGTAFVTFDLTALTMTVDALFAGLVGNVTAAHIHCCTAVAATGTVGVATSTPTFTGFPSGATFGNYDHVFDMTLTSSFSAAFLNANGGPAGAFNALIAGTNAGKAYFNIHSTQFPGGEIRGFLQPVPEPETYALLLAGLGLIGLAARRRHD